MTSCEMCVHGITEEEMNSGNFPDDIVEQFNREKELVRPHLYPDVEEPLFCLWSYLTLGSCSVCSNVEVADDE